MSVQNEPAFEPADYPGMRLSAPLRAALVGRELGPRFASLPSAPMLLEWDHNWDHPEEPLGVLANESARRAVRGVAWHCYGGDVSAQDAVTRAYPTIETWFTECSGGDWAPKFGDNLLWNTEHLIIGTLTHGARGVMLWNLALDAQHGPHLGGCRDCRGVVTLENDGSVRRNVEYWVLAHAAKAFPPGSVRVALDALPVGIRGIAAMRPDGAVGMVLMNGAATAMTLPLSYGTNTHRVDLPPRSVATIVLP
jgi:glucosylceramidase